MRPLFMSTVCMVLGLLACSPNTPHQSEVQILESTLILNNGEYTIAQPLSGFSDFLLIDTQMGNAPPRIVSLEDTIAGLSAYDVVFIGEAHGHATNHYVQSRILAGLYTENPDIALSMEQFERSQQNVVDDYLAGEIGEETLVHDGKAWDHYRQSYRPLVEFAKVKNLPVIAAEIPANLVSCIGESGPEFLGTLDPEPRAWAAHKLHLEDGAYKDKFYGFMDAAAGHTVGGDMSDADKEKLKFNRYAAQVSRDDTMAESIVQHLTTHPGRKIVHVNGSFHSAGLLGTPERVKARLPDIKMANVHPVLVDDPDNPVFTADDLGEGQYLLLLYPTPKRFVKMKNINAFIARTKDAIDADKCAY